MYAIVDIETTGGYAESHRITEIAIIHHDGKKQGKAYRSLLNPGRFIPAYITGLTGITTEMVSNAPRFEEVAKDILAFLEGRVFVAHNAHFDYSFLKKEFEMAGIMWQPKKLCTVRLSRKIIPGLPSYSLGSIAQRLGIIIKDRHRAGGDAKATVQLFETLLLRDYNGYIANALKRNSGETTLPPNLSKGDFDNLPTCPGVYYFLNKHGSVIYVGKAANIKKRITGHFTGDAREWSKQNIRNEIHHIRYELTGTEMVALIMESQEIRRLWPKYNKAQKTKTEEWGIYSYEDRNGYIRFSVTAVMKGSQPLIRLSNKTDAWNVMWERVRAFELCPKLCGLQVLRGLCVHHQSGECKGACEQIEPPLLYNSRAQKLIDEAGEKGDSYAITGAGRTPEEQSVVLIKEGVYVGHGFVEKGVSLSDFLEVQKYIRPGIETPAVQNIINGYAVDLPDENIIFF